MTHFLGPKSLLLSMLCSFALGAALPCPDNNILSTAAALQSGVLPALPSALPVQTGTTSAMGKYLTTQAYSYSYQPETTPTPTPPKTDLEIMVRIPQNITAVIDADFPDPAIFQGPDGKWWAYGTSSHGGPNVRIASADSPLGPWAYDPTIDAKPLLAWTSNINTWAPDVARLDDGTYLLYYSAPRATGGRQCIGAARSTTVNGPYTPDPEPMMCREEASGVIDVSGFHDPVSHKRYVVYKLESLGDININGTNYTTPHFVREVAADGTTFLSDEVLVNWRLDEDGPLIEAPQIVFRRGRYVMFFASHWFTEDVYDTKYAVADKVTGPYKRMGQILGTPVGGLKGPGGTQSVLQEGINVMVFHGWCHDHKDRCMYSAEYTIEEVPAE